MSEAQRIAIIETLKSIGRGLWFAILGLVVTALTAFATSGAVTKATITIGTISINIAFVVVAVVGFGTKAIDTYIHKNENITSNGIAPSFLQK